MSIITGERNAGRIPVDTEFWMVVTSLVSRVTREEVRNLSVLAKENCCSFWNSALRISAPSPWPVVEAKWAYPWPSARLIRANRTI